MSTAATTPTIRLLQDEWLRVVDSEKLFVSIKRWMHQHPLLAHRPPAEIVSTVVRPSWDRDRRRDEALACILEHSREPLSHLITLQSLLPQMTYLIERASTHNTDEFAAHVIATAAELITNWKKRDIICVHWWLYRNIQTRVTQDTRIWQRRRQQEERIENRVKQKVNQIPETASEISTTLSLPDLIAIAMQRGELDRLTAELVVLTRTDCLSIETISRTTGLKPQTLRRKRLRAEKRLKSRLTLTDFI